MHYGLLFGILLAVFIVIFAILFVIGLVAYHQYDKKGGEALAWWSGGLLLIGSPILAGSITYFINQIMTTT